MRQCVTLCQNNKKVQQAYQPEDTSSKSFAKEQRNHQDKNFLSIRIVNEWNSLPSEIVEAPNLKIFERRLDRHWRQHDLKYSFRGVVNCSPVANQWKKTGESDPEEEGAADDLDI